MKVVVVYITVVGGERTEEYALRFAETYRNHAAGYPHDLIAVSSGGDISMPNRVILSSVDRPVAFWQRPNDPGWDISAYIEIAKWMGPSEKSLYDSLIICLGESTHFHRAGWLKRLVDARQVYGPGMYGAFASNTVRAHINTTGFAITPDYLISYPLPVDSHEARYEFEHGLNSIWRYVAALGHPAMLVTWDGCYHPGAWRYPDNILWRGTQRNCLFFCKHTDNWFAADQNRRARWLQMADAPFR